MMLDDIVSRGRGGPPGQFHDNANGGQNGTVQEIMIPAGKAGLVIGKGGETIKQLQVRTPPHPCFCNSLASWNNQGSPLTSAVGLLQVRHLGCVTSPQAFGCSVPSPALPLGIGTRWREDDPDSGWVPEYQCGQATEDHRGPLQSAGVCPGVPGCGAVRGRGGAPADLASCPQQACEMVMDILRERDQAGFGDRNEYGSRIGGGIDVSVQGAEWGEAGQGRGGSADPPFTPQVPVPRHSVGVVIGRSGEMIKKIQNDAGVRIQFKQGGGSRSTQSPELCLLRPAPLTAGATVSLNLLPCSPQMTGRAPKRSRTSWGPRTGVNTQQGSSMTCFRACGYGGGHGLLEGQRVNSLASPVSLAALLLQSGPPGPPGGPGMPPGGRGRGRGQGSWGPPGAEMTFSIPTHKCGLVIGRGEYCPA